MDEHIQFKPNISDRIRSFIKTSTFLFIVFVSALVVCIVATIYFKNVNIIAIYLGAVLSFAVLRLYNAYAMNNAIQLELLKELKTTNSLVQKRANDAQKIDLLKRSIDLLNKEIVELNRLIRK